MAIHLGHTIRVCGAKLSSYTQLYIIVQYGSRLVHLQNRLACV